MVDNILLWSCCQSYKAFWKTASKDSGRFFMILNIIYFHNSQLFFEIEVNSGWVFTDVRSGEVNIPKATIHRD